MVLGRPNKQWWNPVFPCAEQVGLCYYSDLLHLHVNFCHVLFGAPEDTTFVLWDHTADWLQEGQADTWNIACEGAAQRDLVALAELC